MVFVHGIGQQYEGERLVGQPVVAALRDGLEAAGMDRADVDSVEVRSAFYGNVFRPGGKAVPGDLPPLDASDIQQGFEEELLATWWRYTAQVEPQVINPEAPMKVWVPSMANQALWALARSRFWSGIAEAFLVLNLKQVRWYMTDSTIRQLVRAKIASAIESDTRVLVGHSLGSVVAYELLCAHPDWQIKTLVTVGSPLAIPHLIFNRLEPAPHGGVGVWPVGVAQWVNVLDRGDVVTLGQGLEGRFPGAIKDEWVRCGAHAHDATRYLSAAETGQAIRAGLT